MTWALCFNCGATKFGAICPCPECNVASTGDMNLDINFSDHHLSKETLKAFGDVVRSLRQVCDDDQLRFWSFIYYISTNHPEILGVNLGSEQQVECAAVLARANLPAVQVEESERGRRMRQIEEGEGSTDP